MNRQRKKQGAGRGRAAFVIFLAALATPVGATSARPQRRRALGVLALTAAILALAVQGATASISSRGTAASKLRVVIDEQAVYENTTGRLRDTFVLKGAAVSDSGTITGPPTSNSPVRARDGQYFYTVRGTNILHGKQGEVTWSFDGIHVGAGGDFFVEYGTWRILAGTGTGLYKGWRGGGRWAGVLRSTATGDRFTNSWEGLVTR